MSTMVVRQLLLYVLAALLSIYPGVNGDVDIITIKNGEFVNSVDGSRFFVRGVFYSPNVAVTQQIQYDILADSSGCIRDIPYLQKLTINVIQVAGIDPANDHSGCLQKFLDAGIYVLLDLGDVAQPLSFTNWTTENFQQYRELVDEFQSYDNVLGLYTSFKVLDESTANVTTVLPYTKAATRDVHNYMKQKNYRQIPLGYSATDQYDDPTGDHSAVWDYLLCSGPDDESTIDFLAWATFTWCGESSLTISGWNEAINNWASIPVPMFLSEYGCNNVEPRTFTEVEAIYGPQMAPVFSGGVVYNYFNSEANFGLVDLNGFSVQPNNDYDTFSSKMAAAPNPTDSSPSTSRSFPACPTVDSNLQAASSPLPPVPYESLCDCMLSSLGCVAQGGISQSDLTNVFQFVCGTSTSACAGIKNDPNTGQYGAYSVCNATAQASFAINNYYVSQQSQASACDLNGLATLHSSMTPVPTCSDLLAQVGPSGTGTVTSLPSGAGIADSQGASTSGVNPSPGPGGLSTGAEVGIGVGAGLGVLLLLIGAFLLYRRREKARSREQPTQGENYSTGDHMAELAGTGIQPPMADSRPVMEMYAPAKENTEMPTHEMRSPAEMPAYSAPFYRGAFAPHEMST